MPKLSSLFRFPSARRSLSRRDDSTLAAHAAGAAHAETYSAETCSSDPRNSDGLKSETSHLTSSSTSSKKARKANAVKSASHSKHAIDGSHAGMRASSSRLDKQTTPYTTTPQTTTDGIVSASDQAHGVATSNSSTRVTSVEPLHPMVVGANGDAYGSSGVYIVEREPGPQRTEADDSRRANMMNPLLEQVTLVVYGWHNVEPGTLAWVFPSVGAAVAAARAMTNAVRWAIVAGRREASDDDLATARAHGAVLIEQAG